MNTAANDNKPSARRINFGPASVATGFPETIGTEQAAIKVGRAGAPADALASLRRLFEGRMERSRAAEAALSWVAGAWRERPLLAFLGPTGLGKTTAAAVAAFEFARGHGWNSGAGGGVQREPLVWLNAEDIACLQVWFQDGKRQYDDALYARFLVIDDAGHEATRPAIAALTDLLQRRMDAGRVTVLSTNLRGSGFATRYSAPVVDRMKVKAFVPELGSYESMRVRSREPGEDG